MKKKNSKKLDEQLLGFTRNSIIVMNSECTVSPGAP